MERSTQVRYKYAHLTRANEVDIYIEEDVGGLTAANNALWTIQLNMQRHRRPHNDDLANMVTLS